jgi:hypothetical protein
MYSSLLYPYCDRHTCLFFVLSVRYIPMDPRSWGPAAWDMIHSVAYTAPVTPTAEQKQHYASFYSALGNVLPCPGCRIHYNKHLQDHPPDTSSRDALFKWTYELHNIVNRVHGKTQPSFESVVSRYERRRPEAYANVRSAAAVEDVVLVCSMAAVTVYGYRHNSTPLMIIGIALLVHRLLGPVSPRH